MVDQTKPPQTFEEFEAAEVKTPTGSFEEFEAAEAAPYYQPEELGVTQAELDEESALIDEYGSGLAPLRTFLERSASSATFGLSDQALVKAFGPEMAEALKQRKRLNAKSRVLGDITGIAAPMLFSGGSSLLAKGAQLGGAGVVTAAKGAAALERLSAKGLQKIVGDKIKKKIAKDVLIKGVSKGAGSAVEGALYGTGQLVSENALGNKEFNAENVLAAGKEGALWGGLIGAGFGAAPSLFRGAVEVTVPRIKGSKVVGWASKKIDDWKPKYADKEYNAWALSGMDDIQYDNLVKTKPEVAKNGSKVVIDAAKDQNLGIFSSGRKLVGGLKNYKDKVSNRINNVINNIEEIDAEIFPTKGLLAQQLDEGLEKLQKRIEIKGKPVRGLEDQWRVIQEERDKYMLDMIDETVYTPNELNTMKKLYDQNAVKTFAVEPKNLTIAQQMHRVRADVMRKELYALADRAGGNIGKTLRKEMLDYSTIMKYLETLEPKAKRGINIEDFKDIFLAGAAGSMLDLTGIAGIAAGLKAYSKSDLHNRLVVLSGVETANQGVQKTIKKAAKGFLSKKNFTEKLEPVSRRILISSPLAMKDGKKPKDEQEALQNMTDALDEIKSDPSKLMSLSQNELIKTVAPQTFTHMKTVAGRALIFLDSKLPRMFSVNPLLKKKLRPSSQEVYKLKKYMEAIQDPMKVFKEFSKGKISRESIEAISFVYPDIYARMKVEVMQDVDKDPDSIDYKQRLLLGILLNAPTDLALLPDSIKALQQYYSESAVSKSGGKIPVTGAKEIDKAESTATQLEKLQNPERF
jgi:hypothetical protein